MAEKLSKIETGFKVPARLVNREPSTPSATALTMNKLEKGQSFLIRDELQALKAAKVVRDYCARQRERKTEHPFTSRRIGKGMRVWRVK